MLPSSRVEQHVPARPWLTVGGGDEVVEASFFFFLFLFFFFFYFFFLPFTPYLTLRPMLRHGLCIACGEKVK